MYSIVFDKCLPRQCVEDCTPSGCNSYEDVKRWALQLNFRPHKNVLLEYLSWQGAWTLKELNEMNYQELLIKSLWLECWSIKENYLE